jgi:hypothetical protein
MSTTEVKVALNFILSYLYDKLPRRRVNLFGEELEKYLKHKLLGSNSLLSISYTNLYLKPNESRVFYVNKIDFYIDTSLIAACNDSAVDLKELLVCLPNYLKLFIEPGFVGYVTEPSQNEFEFESNFKILYKQQETPNFDDSISSQNNLNENLLKLLAANSSLNGVAAANEQQLVQILLNKLSLTDGLKPVNSESSSSSSSSSISATNTKFNSQSDPPLTPPSTIETDSPKNKKASTTSYITAAEFAQTKFGTTKSKNNSYYNNFHNQNIANLTLNGTKPHKSSSFHHHNHNHSHHQHNQSQSQYSKGTSTPPPNFMRQKSAHAAAHSYLLTKNDNPNNHFLIQNNQNQIHNSHTLGDLYQLNSSLDASSSHQQFSSLDLNLHQATQNGGLLSHMSNGKHLPVSNGISPLELLHKNSSIYHHNGNLSQNNSMIVDSIINSTMKSMNDEENFAFVDENNNINSFNNYNHSFFGTNDNILLFGKAGTSSASNSASNSVSNSASAVQF